MIDIAQARKARARKNFTNFVAYTFKNYEFNWHHLVICELLQKVANGEIRRLIINTPPRHGKTELASIRLPAWYLGTNPGKKVLAASYGAALAEKNSRAIQCMHKTDSYRSLFPQATPGKDQLCNLQTFETPSGGEYNCTGVGGPCTGMGGDLLILDDPIKNYEESCSDPVLNKQWEWFVSTFLTRMQKDGAVVIILTRWTHKDIVGKLLEKSSDDWLVVNLPAISTKDSIASEYDHRDEEGIALWPSRYDTKHLDEVKTLSRGTTIFEALYQGNPTPDTGLFIDADKINIVPAPLDDIVDKIRYWDRAASFGRGDYTVGALLGKDLQNRTYILDVVRERLEPDGVEQLIVSTARADGDDVRIGIERDPAAAGKFEADFYVRRLAGYNVEQCPIPSQMGKITRARPFASQVKAGHVYMIDAPWNYDTLNELRAFPKGANDDQVDAIDGAFMILQSGTSPIERMMQLVGGKVR